MCFLKKQWESVPCPAAPTGSLNRTIAILATRETRELATLLSQHFPKSQILFLHDLESQHQQPEYQYQWKDYDGCVDLSGCGTDKKESLDWLVWLQQLIEHGHREGLMILCVTRGLESYRNNAVNLSGASGVGLYRMLQSEYSHLRSRHIDADPDGDNKTLVQQVVSEFLLDSQDSEVCYREGKRYRACLREIQAGESHEPVPVFPEDHMLWITGGTRGLGYLCAGHFIAHYGVKRLVLTGREVMPPRDQWDSYQQQNTSIGKKIRAIRTLEARGAQVQVLDSLTNEHALQQGLQEIKRTMGPIGGIIHCAGIGDFENPAFIRKSSAGIQQVLDPKVTGLDILIQTFKDEPLQFFILFSSVSAVIPGLAAGHSDYAMANAYMDYAAEANLHACPMVSIQWPSWKETGMGEAKSRAYEQTGLLSLTNAEGLQFLDHILSGKIGPVILPAVVNPGLWKPHQLMQHIIQDNSSTNIQSPRPLAVHPAKNPDALVKATQTWLVELFSRELKIDPSRLDIDTSFQDYGVDSVLLAQLLRSIDQLVAAGPGENNSMADDLDPSILYEYPTIESLAVWLTGNFASSLSQSLGISAAKPAGSGSEKAGVIAGKGWQPWPVRRAAPRPAQARGTDLAVIGLSCRFPGASTLEEYWK
jgi:hypothetical protein